MRSRTSTTGGGRVCCQCVYLGQSCYASSAWQRATNTLARGITLRGYYFDFWTLRCSMMGEKGGVQLN